MSLIRLFNEEEGRRYLTDMGVRKEIVNKLDLIGISCVSNILSAIKTAKYYELNENDIVFTILTDSMELYGSRIKELREQYGKYTRENAIKDYHRYLMGENINYIKELSHYDRKALHNLKYFTWVEQQGKTSDDLRKLWDLEFWYEMYSKVDEWDRDIEKFNDLVGLK